MTALALASLPLETPPGPDWDVLVPKLREAGARHDRDGSFPFDNFLLLQEAGVLGLTVPVALGGQGAGLVESADVVGKVGEACASTALVLAMQLGKQAALARSSAYTPALRDRVGREAVQQGGLLNALRVEKELGSPTRGGLPATVARRVPGGWRISGRKIYSTGGPGLAWFEVLCATDEATPRIGTFLVPAKSPGIRIEESWDQLGLRASGSHDVIFDDVAVSDDHAGILAVPGKGPPPREDTPAAWNAALLGALYSGVARAARDWIALFLHERVPASLGASLATLPRAQEALGEIEALLIANARLIASIARDTDAGTPPSSIESGALKVTLTRAAVEAVRIATTLAGNHGFSRHNPLERHWRDVQCGLVHVPQTDSACIAVGRARLAASKP
ncbi:acyl-CoA dehydrogenase family protein [Roseomonas sp. 18066]|uniref:acyl-CoA dehydrogenase family protein n=1 Tax=Roseomonas sp. 18066 TaxID=2681412 RepID=UPI00135879B9|nr:acyl-CoA dehydrogenase family protein [Roseomonas sp. 18066]